MQNALTDIARKMSPRQYVTPITVIWKLRETLMGGYVPLENPPFILEEVPIDEEIQHVIETHFWDML